jgi:Flp pilus assembly protein TadG
MYMITAEKNMPTSLFDIVRSLIGKIALNKSGVVIIEFALCLPLLLIMGVSGIELTNLQMTNMRISQMTVTAADNLSRAKNAVALSLPQLREYDINDSFIGVKQQTEDMKFLDNGRIILSSLQRNAEDGQWINWQRCKGRLNVASAYGGEDTGETGTSFAGMGVGSARVTAESGSAIIFAEVSYRYQPLFSGDFLPAIIIKDEAAFYVRDDRDLGKPKPSPAVTPSTCNLFTS